MSSHDHSFPGRIGTTVSDSTPWWPETGDGRKRPNVVVVILDDTGWSDFGCYGSEIATPTIDALADAGLRYTRFHVTPLCSPTRAALLSGRNHHSVGMRFLADTDTGFPNSRGSIRPDVPLLPAVLRGEGYGTYLVGKWHLAPLHEITPAGPYGNWPLARGFDRYYGFLDGCTDQYEPELFEDNHPVAVPARDGYHLSEDLADRAIGYVRDHLAFRPRDPFYLQLALGATHAPFQAPREYIEKYLDVFAKGWDETRRDRLRRQVEAGLVPDSTPLVERNDGVRPWVELDDDERLVYTHLQAAFAGFLEHADAQLGRVVAALREFGELDDTVIVVTSDNGASREGGAGGDVDTNAPYSGVRRAASELVGELGRVGTATGGAHYPEGWAMAGNTPFRRYKQFVDLGGVRSPLIVSWRNGPAAPGGIRSEFAHVVDLAPTLYELLGVEPPAGLHGRSLAGGLRGDGEGAAVVNRTQYWETLGHRAIWHDGWRAVTAHVPGTSYEQDVWRLYDTATDFAEAVDLAEAEPGKLAELQELWWVEAAAHDVFPLDDRPLHEVIEARGPIGLFAEERIVLRPGQSHVPFSSAITGSNRSIDVVVRLRGDASAASGVLLSSGNAQGGYVLALDGGVPAFEHQALGERTVLRAPGPLHSSATEFGFRLRSAVDRSGRVELVCGDAPLAEAELPRTSAHLSFWGLDVGRAPVSGFSRLQRLPIDPALVDTVTFAVHAAEDDAAEYAELVMASE
jgi:arylsulfatase